MLKNNYNYILNGISHEVEIKSNIKIKQNPIDEIILISNKFMIKFINDLFDYNSIEYCLIGDSLIGYEIFNGINIFNQNLEITTLKNNYYTIKKIEEYLFNNNFNINFFDNYIEIFCYFFKDYKCIINIYLLDNSKKNLSLIKNKHNIFNFDLYDIFPIKKVNFEEFQVSIPNKSTQLLKKCFIDINALTFKENKINNNIIKLISHIIIIILLLLINF